jgi:hypothetical protein
MMALQNFNDLCQSDIDMLIECDEEFQRVGEYKRVFPQPDIVESYIKYFEVQRYNNLLLWKWIKSEQSLLFDAAISQEPTTNSIFT